MNSNMIEIHSIQSPEIKNIFHQYYVL